MNIKKISVLEISPYVRHSSFISTTQKEFFLPFRVIYDYECYYITEGEMVVKTSDSEVVLGPGDIHFMRPFNWHKRYVKTPTVKYYNLHFDFMRIAENGDFSPYEQYVVPIKLHKKYMEENPELKDRETYEPIEITLPLVMKVSDPAKFVMLFDSINRHFAVPKVSNQLLLKADMLKLMAYLEQENMGVEDFSKSYKYNAVAQFTQSIAEEYSEKLYLSDLALQSGMSPSHMRKMFNKINNISPREYLMNIRIEKAKALLEEGKLSVSEIGKKIGYANVNYFSRVFKNKTKMSPTEYRNSVYSKKKGESDPNFYWCGVVNRPDNPQADGSKTDKKSEK